MPAPGDRPRVRRAPVPIPPLAPRPTPHPLQELEAREATRAAGQGAKVLESPTKGDDGDGSAESAGAKEGGAATVQRL